jgi:hypothetical protein
MSVQLRMVFKEQISDPPRDLLRTAHTATPSLPPARAEPAQARPGRGQALLGGGWGRPTHPPNLQARTCRQREISRGQTLRPGHRDARGDETLDFIYLLFFFGGGAEAWRNPHPPPMPPKESGTWPEAGAGLEGQGGRNALRERIIV